ncbi:DUF6438 domain-containing protein [Salibacteraceae bacterium]|jgi:hypothetical protein|nr:DUF6438 domain-containing protein [Salibacteraceae bacterium]
MTLRIIGVLLISSALLLTASCKNSQKAENTSKEEALAKIDETNNSEAATKSQVPSSKPAEEVMPEEQAKPERPAPNYPDTLVFRMQRTPCFGQCPTYTINIYQSGWSLLEGKQFFDYEGFYTTKFTEEDLIQIENLAKKYGYDKMDHVYDAPVTDLPSTTTIVNTESMNNWVYNRMNSPDELRSFEREMETMIKDKQWRPSAKGGGKGDMPE